MSTINLLNDERIAILNEYGLLTIFSLNISSKKDGSYCFQLQNNIY